MSDKKIGPSDFSVGRRGGERVKKLMVRLPMPKSGHPLDLQPFVLQACSRAAARQRL